MIMSKVSKSGQKQRNDSEVVPLQPTSTNHFIYSSKEAAYILMIMMITKVAGPYYQNVLLLSNKKFCTDRNSARW